MKSALAAFAAAAVLGAAGSASAAITLEAGSFGGSYGVHSVPGLNASSVAGLIGGVDPVTLSTTGDTLVTSGGGLSKFEGGDGSFNDLLITFTKGYGQVTFNINTLNKVATSFDLVVNGAVNLSAAGLANGENMFIVKATDLDTISSLAFTFTNPAVTGPSPGVQDIRQIRVAEVVPSAVPEPATWAMMIIGFLGVGAMLRRGRREGALATAA